jgi:hypothetical protein
MKLRILSYFFLEAVALGGGRGADLTVVWATVGPTTHEGHILVVPAQTHKPWYRYLEHILASYGFNGTEYSL